MADEKPGVKTSEWWTSLMVMIGGLVPAVVSVLSGYPWAGAAFAAIAFAAPIVYIVGRAWIKAEKAGTIDLIPEVWENRFNETWDLIESLEEAVKAALTKKSK